MLIGGGVAAVALGAGTALLWILDGRGTDIRAEQTRASSRGFEVSISASRVLVISTLAGKHRRGRPTYRSF
jgi:hypothetical protein